MERHWQSPSNATQERLREWLAELLAVISAPGAATEAAEAVMRASPQQLGKMARAHSRARNG